MLIPDEFFDLGIVVWSRWRSCRWDVTSRGNIVLLLFLSKDVAYCGNVLGYFLTTSHVSLSPGNSWTVILLTFLDHLVHDPSLLINRGVFDLGRGLVELLLVAQRGGLLVLGRVGVGVVLRHVDGA